MIISPDTRLGRYEIRSQLGAGGMGEVYLARDPKINRDVAIKVLPAVFSTDSERLRRFEQEAQARDGKELFYIAVDGKLMAVDVKLGATFEAGVPKTLFGTRVLSLTDFRNHYAVTADGQRFLINSTIEETTAPISVVVNWTANLKH